jgi:hypothetical protein
MTGYKTGHKLQIEFWAGTDSGRNGRLSNYEKSRNMDLTYLFIFEILFQVDIWGISQGLYVAKAWRKSNVIQQTFNGLNPIKDSSHMSLMYI